MKIKPLPCYFLVEPIEDDQTSAGGVYLPETSKDKPMKGKVVAMNPLASSKDPQVKYFLVGGEKIVAPELQVGKTVFYKKWTNQEVQHEGKEYLLIHFNELLAIIE